MPLKDCWHWRVKIDTATAAPRKKRVFYGWWITVAGAIVLALNSGVWMYGFSAFFLPLTSAFGSTRAALSGAISLSSLVGGLLAPIDGFLIDKLGPRKMMFFGITLWGAGFILLSRVNSLMMFYVVVLAFLNIGSGLGTFTPVTVAVTNWFIKKRSRALGITLSGLGVGGMLVPVVAWLISQYGWRTTVIITGIMIWVIGLPLASLMRHKPEQYGYLPDGETAEALTASQMPKARKVAGHRLLKITAKKVSREEIDFTAREALRTPAFWLLAISFALRFLTPIGLSVHFIPYLQDKGISAQTAASFLGAVGVISVIGRLAFGWLGDIFDKRYMMAGVIALMLVGLLILVNAQSSWQFIIFLAVYAPAYGGGVSLMLALRGEFFGRKAYATIGGLMSWVTMWGSIAGPVFAGYIFDVTGSYRLAFLIMAAALAVAIVLTLVAKYPTPPRSKTPEA